MRLRTWNYIRNGAYLIVAVWMWDCVWYDWMGDVLMLSGMGMVVGEGENVFVAL